MAGAEDGANTFLRVDEFNESSGQVDGLDLSQQQVPQESWIADAEELREAPAPPTGDTADTGQPAESRSSARPGLRRDQWAPPPQQPPPPAPPDAVPEDADVPTDSLSLAQLRRIVQDIPKKEATPYAFTYQDYSIFEEEVEELFDYSLEERAYLAAIPKSFGDLWSQWLSDSQDAIENALDTASWLASDTSAKQTFLTKLKEELQSPHKMQPERVMQALNYLALGCWQETARPQAEDVSRDADGGAKRDIETVESSYEASKGQVQVMKANLVLIANHVGLDPIFETFKSACLHLLPEDSSLSNSASHASNLSDFSPGTSLPRCSSVLLYLLIEHGRRQAEPFLSPALATQCRQAGPTLLHFLTVLLAEMRWSDSAALPLLKIMPIYWKAILTTFGGTDDVEKIRTTLNQDARPTGDSRPMLTASPLDYHLFRQEITSKYPAFDPPQPLFPFESDSVSMVPPLQEHPGFEKTNEAVGPTSVNGTGSSILHQPVHIATPAPSPPPSPAGPGGKGIKKQNYQTNQMFPFLYPPLSDGSNQIDGKDGEQLQDLLADKNWEGSDIPTSILEAADIFASRMRATRSMKQLWDERVRFMKYERGYLTSQSTMDTADDSKEPCRAANETDSSFERLNEDQKRRLRAVEDFYASDLPRLQSVIIVLLKVLLQTVTTLVTQPNVPNGLQTGFESPEQHPQDKPENSNDGKDSHSKNGSSALNNLNTVRSQEIMGKSVSGILVLLLKWFKLSHILKFEYLSQLLLDSNYIQLILKLFTHQDLERVVNFKCEKKSLNFFNFCRRNASSTQGSPQPNSQENISPTADDAAAPPPIPFHRDTNVGGGEPDTAVNDAAVHGLEVDELGYSTSDIPTAPITNFSWRAFFTAINHLRILQKIVKSKPHRQLVMVQYKYSNILKKSLKVPQPDIRLYTLKVIKGQVPYCHRKWRQSNMRIITAIYLHCKPELRDDWLAGLTMEEEMGEALPQEQALRSLTYWYNLRRYPGAVTDDAEKARGLLEEEHDFFVRELESMEAAFGEGVGDVSVGGEVDPLEPIGEAHWTKEEREAFFARTREIVEQGPPPARDANGEDYVAGLERIYGTRVQDHDGRAWRAG